MWFSLCGFGRGRLTGLVMTGGVIVLQHSRDDRVMAEGFRVSRGNRLGLQVRVACYEV